MTSASMICCQRHQNRPKILRRPTFYFKHQELVLETHCFRYIMDYQKFICALSCVKTKQAITMYFIASGTVTVRPGANYSNRSRIRREVISRDSLYFSVAILLVEMSEIV